MKPWAKILLGSVVSLIIILLIAGYFFKQMLYNSLPEYEGEFPTDKIKSDVTIYFDSLAIPYITTEKEESAAFALGFLHARERMFQMDLIRRAGEGRLSEVFGRKTLAFDQMFLTVGIKQTAAKMFEAAHPETRKVLSSYADGVNYFIKKFPKKLPIEFDVLKYEPYPWKPVHSFMIVRLMAWELNMSWWTDIIFTKLVQQLGEEKAMLLLPGFPENAPTIIPSSLSKAPKINTAFIDVNNAYKEFTGFTGTHIGSNNWVVNKQKSQSGKAIIANDPHLAFTAPGKWYAAVIRAGDYQVEGVTLPGVPAVVIGKNKNISWVLTNVMADDADFYFEKLDRTGKKYFLNNEWHNLKIRIEKIKVKDEPDASIEIKETHRGPIISHIHAFNSMYPNSLDKNLNISMRWTGNDVSDEFFAFYSVNKAGDWNSFKTAVSNFSVPGQNFVYADVKGNIGYLCAAKLPVRSTNSPTFVFDGTTSANDWKGFVPFEQIPALFNPPQNFIASANNKTVKDFPHHISNLWEPSSRIERITELLTAKEKYSAEDFEHYQTDFVSPYAKNITGYILQAFEGKKLNDKNLTDAIQLFKEWDGKFDAYYQAPAIYAVFLTHLLKNTFEDDLGYDLFNEFLFVPNVPYRVVQRILTENTSTIFDDKKTSKIETRDDIIRKSLSDALTDLETKMGTDIKQWQWGKLHTLKFKHFFSGENKFIDGVVDIGPFGIGGDGTTLFNTEYTFNHYAGDVRAFQHNEYENHLGPSMRFIYDFAHPDEFYLVLPTGQSGHPLSKHYQDQTGMWLRGKYVKIKTDPASISSLKNKISLVK
ncbi:MAG: penicillin amidase [Ignavibacteria bacterium CG22_combo_CG10-13_8_21_14_all_37_15]|nr:MAG: penicillin amidase [Ignavibacteria bacterium CG22_combo_CG10-13_8_21_14_all_37_15]